MKKLLAILGLLFILSPSPGLCSGGPQDWALKAIILPETPSIYDSIDILSSATSGCGPVTIEGSFFQKNGTDLTLNLDFKIGISQVITPWSYTESIGTLHAGIYDLTVIANYDYSDFTASEEYFTSFEVVPEPAAIVLLCFGWMLIRA